MPSFDVEFEVYCATCNAGLCNISEGVRSRGRGELAVRVEACSDCLEKAKDEAREEGRREGFDEGVQSVK